MTMGNNDQHRIEIATGRITVEINDPPTQRKVYQALCDCGYAGPPYFTHAHAEQDGDEHVLGMH